MKCKFNVKGMWNSFKLTAKDWSPEAYILLGIAGGVYAAVKACQASRKLDDVLEEHKDDVTEVREAYSDCPEEEKKEERKELAKVLRRITRLIRLRSSLLGGCMTWGKGTIPRRIWPELPEQVKSLQRKRIRRRSSGRLMRS